MKFYELPPQYRILIIIYVGIVPKTSADEFLYTCEIWAANLLNAKGICSFYHQGTTEVRNSGTAHQRHSLLCCKWWPHNPVSFTAAPVILGCYTIVAMATEQVSSSSDGFFLWMLKYYGLAWCWWKVDKLSQTDPQELGFSKYCWPGKHSLSLYY